MARWGDFFWWRLLYGLAILPVIAVIAYWQEGKIDEVTVPVIGFFVVWEAGVIALARWRRIWPFSER